MPDRSPSPSSSAAAAVAVAAPVQRTEESKEQTSAAGAALSTASLLSPKSARPTDSFSAFSAAASPSPTSRAKASSRSRSGRPSPSATARAGGEKNAASAGKKKKKARIAEDACMVRRLVEHAGSGAVEALRHVLQMEGEPRLDFDATAGEALVAAAENGHCDVITLLLDHGASVDCLNGRPLQRACASNRLATATLLLMQGADPTAAASLTGFTPLMSCCMASDSAPHMRPTSAALPPSLASVDPAVAVTARMSPQSVRLLHTTAAASAQPSAILTAVLSPSQSSVSAHSSSSFATSAARSSRSPRNAVLLPQAPTPVSAAATDAESRVPLLRLLLSYPSCLTSVDAQCSSVYCGPYNGWAALHFAADADRSDLVEALLTHGAADVDARTAQGDTALAIAAERGHADVVRVFLAHRADIHATRRGLSVVEWCLYRAEPDLVHYCVARGARADLGSRASWFPQRGTLLDVLRSQLSEALLDRLHLALHRGSRICRQNAAVRDVLLIHSWQTASSGDAADGTAEAKRSVMKACYLPGPAIDSIVAYQSG